MYTYKELPINQRHPEIWRSGWSHFDGRDKGYWPRNMQVKSPSYMDRHLSSHSGLSLLICICAITLMTGACARTWAQIHTSMSAA